MKDLGLVGNDKLVGDLAHGSEVILGVLDVLESLRVIRLGVSVDQALESLLVVIPSIPLRIGLKLSGLGSLGGSLAGRLARAGLLLAGRLLLHVILSLASASRGRCWPGRGGRSRLGGGAVVVVDSPHVVPQVPLSGKAVSWLRALASFIGAQVWLLAMSMHGVGLTLMAEQASSRRETGILASLNLAAVGLQMGIHKFARFLVSGVNLWRVRSWQSSYS